MKTVDPIELMRAENYIRQVVMDNSFTVRHDVEAIVREFWQIFGHFDWEIIGWDTDRYWAIIEKHRIY
ncbi:MAG: hypothetical protein HLX51_06455 [Micrococcaceae bacterium]|nr:hypothetical protein [Micrococcaceae bacterium]